LLTSVTGALGSVTTTASATPTTTTTAASTSSGAGLSLSTSTGKGTTGNPLAPVTSLVGGLLGGLGKK
jgi:hypothetical protein